MKPASSSLIRCSGSRQAALPAGSLRADPAGWRAIVLLTAFALLAITWHTQAATGDVRMKFKQVRTQFIAALGDPTARSGTGAESWGLWRVDPGPRGVWLNRYQDLKEAGGLAPANWQFDGSDWWLDENGLIMEKPEFPLPPGNYLVTGDREVTTVLTVHPSNKNGTRRWELHNGATLFDVTHLPCRSARYTPASNGTPCSPAAANPAAFPVAPGDTMPAVEGCNKVDHAVLFIVGTEVRD